MGSAHRSSVLTTQKPIVIPSEARSLLFLFLQTNLKHEATKIVLPPPKKCFSPTTRRPTNDPLHISPPTKPLPKKQTRPRSPNRTGAPSPTPHRRQPKIRHVSKRSPAPSPLETRWPGTNQRTNPRPTISPSPRIPAPRHALRLPPPKKIPRLHHCHHSRPRPGHRRQHRTLQYCQRRPSSSPPIPAPRTTHHTPREQAKFRHWFHLSP